LTPSETLLVSPPRLIPSYETHLPAFEAHAQAAIWFSRPHENQGRPRHLEPPSSARTQTSPAERCRNPFRTPHPGLIASGSRSHRDFAKPTSIRRSGSGESPFRVACCGWPFFAMLRELPLASASSRRAESAAQSFAIACAGVCARWHGIRCPLFRPEAGS